MENATRRNFLAGVVMRPNAGAPSRRESAAATACAAVSGREMIRDRYFPNITLTTHEGRRVRFYDDLIKDKVVVINLMYADCADVCPIITANLVQVQKLLRNRVGNDLFIYSITIKPKDDTPTKLKEYAEAHETGPGWLFLTGKLDDIELLRHKLGYVDPDPNVDKDKSRHAGVLRYGNEPLSLWGTCQGSAKPEWIAESISWVLPKTNKVTAARGSDQSSASEGRSNGTPHIHHY
jgi:protein SCO1/2